MKILYALACGLAFMALGGCASFSEDGGFDRVQSLVTERGGPQPVRVQRDGENAAAEVRRLLGQELSVDDAVRVALLNNPGLQAEYAALGIAEADLVQAGRLPNPGFSFARLKRGDQVEYDRTFIVPFMALLTMPAAQRIESAAFERSQMRVASETLRLADETRRAYFGAVAAQESLRYMERVQKAAAAGAELGRRMAEAGNWSVLQQAREQSFYVDASARLARSKLSASIAREQLARLMAVQDVALLKLPERLPDLPAEPRNVGDAEALALQNRLDILMAEKELAALSDSLGLTRSTRFISTLDLGYQHNTADGEPHQTGYEIDFQIPLFDWGDARVARAQSAYLRGARHTAQIVSAARAEVRISYATYRTAYELARQYRDEIIPLRQRISAENQLRYNGMLISVFELLEDARMQYVAVTDAIDAARDYWVADSALRMAMSGGSSGAVALREAPAATKVGH